MFNNKERVIIADVIDIPESDDMKYVAFLYGHDLEDNPVDRKATLMNHNGGHYINVHSKTLETFKHISNIDGDYPVFHADLIGEGDLHVPSLSGLETPTEAFNYDKHVENTPNGTTLYNRQLDTSFEFQKPHDKEQDRSVNHSQFERIVVADAIIDPKDPNMFVVGMLYANDLELKHDEPTLVNESHGHYIRMGRHVYDHIMDHANTDGTHPVINAPVHQFSEHTALVQSDKVLRPDVPFDINKHTEHTPKGTTLVNKRLNRDYVFSMPSPTEYKKEHLQDLEL